MTVESALTTRILSFMTTPVMTAERASHTEAVESSDTSRTHTQGDSISISEEARTLHAQSKTENPYEVKMDADETKQEELLKKVKEQIEKLQEEIRELEESNLPEKEKQKKLQEKRAHLQELLDQLERLKGGGNEYFGGTRAEGFGGSVHNF